MCQKNALWGVFANKKYKDFFSNSKQHMVVFCKKRKKTHKYSTITFIPENSSSKNLKNLNKQRHLFGNSRLTYDCFLQLTQIYNYD